MEEMEVTCPHCGAPHLLLVDTTERGSTYIEDCSVCCRPMTVYVDGAEEGEVSVHVEVA